MKNNYLTTIQNSNTLLLRDHLFRLQIRHQVFKIQGKKILTPLQEQPEARVPTTQWPPNSAAQVFIPEPEKELQGQGGDDSADGCPTKPTLLLFIL